MSGRRIIKNMHKGNLVRRQCFYPPMPDKKTETTEGSNKRKSFVEPVGTNGSNYNQRTLEGDSRGCQKRQRVKSFKYKII